MSLGFLHSLCHAINLAACQVQFGLDKYNNNASKIHITSMYFVKMNGFFRCCYAELLHFLERYCNLIFFSTPKKCVMQLKN